MNGLQAVTDLSVYLANNTDIKVFKYEKQAGYVGDYIVVNSLPFSFGSAADGTLNANIHIADLGNGLPNTKRAYEVATIIFRIIPRYSFTEDSDWLEINSSYYAIESDSNLIKDEDNTHFINLKIKVLFNALNQ